MIKNYLRSFPRSLRLAPESNSIARLLDFRQLQLHDEHQGGCEPRSLSHGHLGDDPTGGDLVHHRIHLPSLALVEGRHGGILDLGILVGTRRSELPQLNKQQIL